MANRRVALAEALGDVNNNLNAGCSNDVECFVANSGQVERFVVVSPCGEHQAIVQSRCSGCAVHVYSLNVGALTQVHTHILGLREWDFRVIQETPIREF